MEQLLARKLYEYLCRNHPDLIIREGEKSINELICSKIQQVIPVLDNLLIQSCPAYIIEELCMDQMTQDLKPSKFHYITRILEEEFEGQYLLMKEAGVLAFEITNIIEHCNYAFEKFGFSVLSEDDPQLYHTVTGMIEEYLKPINTRDYGL